MKKIVSALLVATMLVSMLVAAMPASAQTTGTTVTFTVSTYETTGITAGEQFTLSVSTSAVDSIAAVDVKLSYDKHALTPVSYTKEGYLANFDIATITLNPTYVENADPDNLGEVSISALALTAASGTEDEVIATITFEALTDMTAASTVLAFKTDASSGDAVPHDTAAVPGGVAIVELKNGIVEENGAYYYYVDGVMQKDTGMIEVDGDLYYVCYSGKLKQGNIQTVTEEKANGLVDPGTYTFGDDCKMVVETKDGIVYEDGVYHYYVDGVMQKDTGMIEVDGDLYYVCYSGKLKQGNIQTVTEEKANGLVDPGTYTFGDDAKMVVDSTNGIVYEDGVYHYYIDGVMQKDTGMIEVDGDLYYVCYSGKLKQGNIQTVTEEKANGLVDPGTYTFGDDAKMVVDSTNGIVYEDGVYHYYIDGVMQKDIGLIKVDGYYYYVCYSGKLKQGNIQTVTEEKANGLVDPGTYTFGDDAKMVVESAE